MRILTDDEMDIVFGGADSTLATNLPTVNVVGQRSSYQSGSGYFYTLSNGYSGYQSEQTCSCPSGPQVSYPINISNYVTPNKLRCLVDEAADPGHGAVAGYEMKYVSSWAWQSSLDTASMRLSNYNGLPMYPMVYRPGEVYKAVNGATMVEPSSYQQGSNGVAYPVGTVALYGGAFESQTAGTNSKPYYNDVGDVVTRKVGAMTAQEKLIMVAAHEYQHVYQFMNPGYLGGLDAEYDAETFALRAFDRYRANKAAIDEKCKDK